MAIWRCEDCNKVGFYFDITPEEMREKHSKECEVIMVEELLNHVTDLLPPVVGAGWYRKPDVDNFKIYEIRVPKDFK
jgi:hypothetical protein